MNKIIYTLHWTNLSHFYVQASIVLLSIFVFLSCWLILSFKKLIYIYNHYSSQFFTRPMRKKNILLIERDIIYRTVSCFHLFFFVHLHCIWKTKKRHHLSITHIRIGNHQQELAKRNNRIKAFGKWFLIVLLFIYYFIFFCFYYWYK